MGPKATLTSSLVTILHEMGELLQSCDDSDGIVSGMIQHCLDLVHVVACDLESNFEINRPAMLQLAKIWQQRKINEDYSPLIEGMVSYGGSME